MAVITRELQHTQQQLREITQDQVRLRANIKDVPQGSAATKRYVDKAPISDADRKKIFEDNARRVYPRLKAHAAVKATA